MSITDIRPWTVGFAIGAGAYIAGIPLWLTVVICVVTGVVMNRCFRDD